MQGKIQLDIVTPERKLVSELVDEVTAPGSNGYFGVLPGHTHFLATLKLGEICYRQENQQKHLAVFWGYAEVMQDRVTILAQIAEKADEIDLERAQAAKLRAEQRLASHGENIDFDRAQIALQKALIRLQVAAKQQ